MIETNLHHCAIRTTHLEPTRAFYADLLGLEVGDRPPLPVPGYWLYGGGQPVIHLIEVQPDDEVDVIGEPYSSDMAAGYRNGVDHVAFNVKGLDEMRQRLKDSGVDYQERGIPELGMVQLFARDPNGIVAELNFFLDQEETAQAEVRGAWAARDEAKEPVK